MPYGICVPRPTGAPFRPLELITEVFETLKVQFRKENLLKLLATANLITKTTADYLDEAKRMVREGPELATRAVGSH